jgi:hypothetical protein
MPPLPKKNKKKESDFGLWFRKYDAEHNLPSGSYELKQTENDSIPFSAVELLQIDSALRTESKKGNLVRVQKGTTGAADYLKQREEPAYIVIRFPSVVCFIRISDFIREKNTSLRKSLTSSHAKELCTVFIDL